MMLQPASVQSPRPASDQGKGGGDSTPGRAAQGVVARLLAASPLTLHQSASPAVAPPPATNSASKNVTNSLVEQLTGNREHPISDGAANRLIDVPATITGKNNDDQPTVNYDGSVNSYVEQSTLDISTDSYVEQSTLHYEDSTNSYSEHSVYNYEGLTESYVEQSTQKYGGTNDYVTTEIYVGSSAFTTDLIESTTDIFTEWSTPGVLEGLAEDVGESQSTASDPTHFPGELMTELSMSRDGEAVTGQSTQPTPNSVDQELEWGTTLDPAIVGSSSIDTVEESWTTRPKNEAEPWTSTLPQDLGAHNQARGVPDSSQPTLKEEMTVVLEASPGTADLPRPSSILPPHPSLRVNITTTRGGLVVEGGKGGSNPSLDPRLMARPTSYVGPSSCCSTATRSATVTTTTWGGEEEDVALLHTRGASHVNHTTSSANPSLHMDSLPFEELTTMDSSQGGRGVRLLSVPVTDPLLPDRVNGMAESDLENLLGYEVSQQTPTGGRLSGPVVVGLSVCCSVVVLAAALTLLLWICRCHRNRSKVYLSTEMARPRAFFTKPLSPALLPHEAPSPALPQEAVYMMEFQRPRAPILLSSDGEQGNERPSRGVRSSVSPPMYQQRSEGKGETGRREEGCLGKNVCLPKYQHSEDGDSGIRVWSSTGSLYTAGSSPQALTPSCPLPPPPYSPSLGKDPASSLCLSVHSLAALSKNSSSQLIHV